MVLILSISFAPFPYKVIGKKSLWVLLAKHFSKCCGCYFDLINLMYILSVSKSSHFDESRHTFSVYKRRFDTNVAASEFSFEKSQADVILRHKIAFEHIHMGIYAILRDIY